MSRRIGLWCVVPMLVIGAVRAEGQSGEMEPLARGPRFLAPSAPSAQPLRLDVSRVAVLRQRIAVTFDGIPLRSALAQIEAKSGLDLDYSDAVVPLDRPVHLTADDITVAAALTVVLLDADVDVMLQSERRGLLLRRGEASRAVGTVVGRVTDAKTGEPLLGAEVRLEGTRWRAGTTSEGRYRLTEVVPGEYLLAVRRIGYARRVQPVTVADGQEATVDVALEPVPTKLDEVVTTVTGEQRIRELGHVVGRINADSVVREAPVASVTELLNARVPGLQVFTGQGTVGGDAAIRIRGATTGRLSQEPIVIVDGVRYAGDRQELRGSVSANQEPTSRLNDLNPNDIESIEVVKGPSAATLYGTDAANGVIVITTKRGRPGPARWNAYARASMSEIPVSRFPDGAWGWSSTTTANCTLARVAQGSCTQDSVTTVPNPLNDAELTIFGNAPRWEYGANVSGGGRDVRYFVSADFEDATGPIQMPSDLIDQMKESRGVSELPEEQLDPNGFTKVNLRSNLSAELGERFGLQLSAGYTQNATRTVAVTSGPYTTSAFDASPENPYGTSYSPDRAFSAVSTERINRFTGSMRMDAQPWSWLTAWGAVGVDLGSTTRNGLVDRGVGPAGMGFGAVDDTRRRDVLTTADLGTRASFQFGRLSARTAAGVQYVHSLSDAATASGIDLPPGAETVSSAAIRTLSSSYTETATLGGFLEQTFGLNERLYLTGALRADGTSTFGRDYDAVVYPKASVSWLVSEEPFVPRIPGLAEFRLRYAFGASGRQPLAGMAHPSYLQQTALVEGTVGSTLLYYGLGNPDLRPERTREHELGFDGALLGGRLRLEGTWYFRTTVDGIQTMALQPGYGSKFVNVGLVKDRGFEGQLWAQVIDNRSFSWNLSLQHSSNSNRLVDIGDAAPVYHRGGGLVEGYPIGARFMVPLLGHEDANGNGIVESSEIVFGDSAVYAGQSAYPRTQTLHTAIGLFNQRLRVTAMFERRSGATQYDQLGTVRCSSGYCRSAVDSGTPLDEQAQVAALFRYPSGLTGGTSVAYVYMDDADFVRFRELAMAFDLPDRLVRSIGLRQATLGLAVRNLAMWSSFRGIDAESVVGAGSRTAVDINGAGGTPDGIPQARSWVLRLDVGF